MGPGCFKERTKTWRIASLCDPLKTIPRGFLHLLPSLGNPLWLQAGLSRAPGVNLPLQGGHITKERLSQNRAVCSGPLCTSSPFSSPPLFRDACLGICCFLVSLAGKQSHSQVLTLGKQKPLKWCHPLGTLSVGLLILSTDVLFAS